MQQRDLLHLIDADLERRLLGGILSAGERAYREASLLNPDDFGIEQHRIIFGVMQRIAPEVDPTLNAVIHALGEIGKLDSVGGITALLDIDQAALPGDGLAVHAKTLRAKANGRRAWKLADKVTREIELHGLNGNAPDVAAAAQELIGLTEGVQSAGLTSVADLPGVCASAEPVRFIREPELPEGAIVGATGDSGSGKSSLATAYARDAIASGRPVLILDRENPRSVVAERMARLALSDGPQLRWWGGWLGDVPGPASATVSRWVEYCNPKPLIVIDTLVAFLDGADENDAGAMRAFMTGVRRLADRGATIILIHHDGKSETARDFRGSSDFKAAVDQAFHVSNIGPDGKLDRLTLRFFKSRFGFAGSLVYFYAGGKFVRDERHDAPARNLGDQLTGLLREHPGVGSREFEELAVKMNLGRSRARDFLTDGVLSGVIRREDAGRNRFKHHLAEAE